MAVSGNDAGEWKDAMVNEIQGLLRQNTWKILPRSLVPKDKHGNHRTMLPGTWAFKLKRLLDGSPLKLKARYFVRGTKQVVGIDYSDTYAPVVQWSTIRMVIVKSD